MITSVIITLIVLSAFGIWFWKKGIILLAEKNAIGNLESMLFSEGNHQKKRIITSMHEMTNEKYSEDELLDYFLKIKGLQVVNFYDPVNFWTRKYLMSPTKLKLNYFEQVKFYETFLNYPESTRLSSDKNNAYLSSEPKGVFFNKRQLA